MKFHTENNLIWLCIFGWLSLHKFDNNSQLIITLGLILSLGWYAQQTTKQPFTDYSVNSKQKDNTNIHHNIIDKYYWLKHDDEFVQFMLKCKFLLKTNIEIYELLCKKLNRFSKLYYNLVDKEVDIQYKNTDYRVCSEIISELHDIKKEVSKLLYSSIHVMKYNDYINTYNLPSHIEYIHEYLTYRIEVLAFHVKLDIRSVTSLETDFVFE